MIQITPHMRIFLLVEPADFRKGIDGFARVCNSILKEDPFSGHLFVFRNKSGNSIKILIYDGKQFEVLSTKLGKDQYLWVQILATFFFLWVLKPGSALNVLLSVLPREPQ